MSEEMRDEKLSEPSQQEGSISPSLCLYCYVQRGHEVNLAERNSDKKGTHCDAACP